jgi:phage antirepressor YoqD-like protein
MKRKDTHIVFGRGGRGTLIHSKEFDLDNIRLICLEDTLNIGPVCDLYSPEKIAKREEFFNNFEFCPPVCEDIKILRTFVKDTEKSDRIFLWTGFDALEILGTARILYYLQKLDKNIFITDFPNIPVKNIFGKTIYPTALVQTSLTQVREIAKHFNRITDEKLTEWGQLWEKINAGNSMLKILDRSGEILETDETYFDALLESNCSNEFQNAARVIGKTLVDIYFNVGDGYLNWRLKQLCLMKKIESRGTLNEIRDYEVKLPDIVTNF